MIDDRIIMKRVQQHVDAEQKQACLFGDWMICAANGSVNYGLETADSDVDTKMIYVPTMWDIVHNKMVSHTYELAELNGEHCDVKDIREYVKMLFKSNINFMETLYSPFVAVNPKYGKEWARLVAERDALAYQNPVASVNCMMGMARRYESLTNSSEKVGKCVYHIFRMAWALEKYSKQAPYSEVIVPSEQVADYLRSIKTGEIGLTDSSLKYLARTALASLEDKYTNVYLPAAQKMGTSKFEWTWENTYNIVEDVMRKGSQK